MYANDSGSYGGSQHPAQPKDLLPNYLDTEPQKIITVLVNDCDEADRNLMRQAGKQNGVTIEQAKAVYQLGQSGTSRRLLRLLGDKSRPYPVNPPLLCRRKLKGQGSGQGSYQYYYAPYVTLELVEQAIARNHQEESGQIQLETIKINTRQPSNESVFPKENIDIQNCQVFGETNLGNTPESQSLTDKDFCQEKLAATQDVSREHNDSSSDVEEFAESAQAVDSTKTLTFEERVARMLSLMAQKIKEQQREIDVLKNLVAELDRTPQNRAEIFDAVEAELKTLFVSVEIGGKNGKNTTK